MFESISCVEAPDLGEVWITIPVSDGPLYDWIDLRPLVPREYRGLPLKELAGMYDDEGEFSEWWVLSTTDRGLAQTVDCPACIHRVLASDEDAPKTNLIADDPAGVFGWAWCPTCGYRLFIPMREHEVGIELTHGINRSSGLPVLVEVFS